MVSKPQDPETPNQITLFDADTPVNRYKKAVQVVHAKPSVPLTLLQGKLSNCFLKNALETRVDDEGWWSISIQTISVAVNFDSNNSEYLKNSSRELMKVVFEYDLLAKPSDTKAPKWKASVLFPEIELHEGRIRYQISNQMRERVLNPEVYALIDLNVLRRFKRSSSIPLYEHCARFVKLGKTAVVDLEIFRDIILGAGSGAGIYGEYKYFKQKILNPSIAEINTFSEITIEKIVETKNGRKVSALQFIISKKTTEQLYEPDEAEVDIVSTALMMLGLTPVDVKKLLKTRTVHELMAALDYTKKRMTDRRKTPLDKPVSYFHQALENGWGIVDAEAGAVAGELSKDGDVKSKGTGNTIAEAFREHQINEARRYFDKMDVSEREIAIARYNEQQDLRVLKMRLDDKARPQAQTAFLRWLAIDTYGEPTEAHLLEFAEYMLRNR